MLILTICLFSQYYNVHSIADSALTLQPLNEHVLCTIHIYIHIFNLGLINQVAKYVLLHPLTSTQMENCLVYDEVVVFLLCWLIKLFN